MGEIRRRNVAGCALVVTAAMASSSCFLGHKQPARVFIPPPQPPSTASAKTSPPVLPVPPTVAASGDASQAPQVPPAVVVLTPPPPAPVAKRPPKPAPKAQVTPPPPAPQEPSPSVAPMRQIFTPQQLEAYNRSLKESFDRVDSALAKLEGKKLNAGQIQTADRIRTFRKQAEQAREQDLVTAVSLAKRADLLAKDLLGRLP